MRTRVLIKDNWHMDGHDVWIVETNGEEGPAYTLYPLREGLTGWERVEWKPNVADAPPSFTLPRGVLEMIVSQGSELKPPNVAQAEHLKDAMNVRDRLLRFVERTQGEPDGHRG